MLISPINSIGYGSPPPMRNQPNMDCKLRRRLVRRRELRAEAIRSGEQLFAEMLSRRHHRRRPRPIGVGGLRACDDKRDARSRQDSRRRRIQPDGGADQATENPAGRKRNVYAGPAGVIVIAEGRVGMLVVIVVIIVVVVVVPGRREAR